MALNRFLIGWAVVVMTVVTVAAPVSAEEFPGHAPAEYVVMGDSYSSGEGLDPMFEGGYYDGTDERGVNMCHRSSLAYGPRLADTLEASGQIAADAWLMPACSGDEVGHLRNGSGKDNSPNRVAQLDRLTPETEYVTLTVGGNDIGFGDIGSACYEILAGGLATWGPGASNTRCRAQLLRAHTMNTDGTMRGRLLELYRRVLQRAPNARVVVVTYPRLFPTNANYTGAMIGGRRYCVLAGSANAGAGFRANVVNASDPATGVFGINQVEAELNQLVVATVNHIRTVDGLPGRISVARLDVGEVAGHPYACGEGGHPQEYVNGGRITTNDDSSGPGALDQHLSPASFHPNEAGHHAFADVIAPKLQPSAQLAIVATSATGARITAAEPLRIRVGTSGHAVTVDPTNGTPAWSDLASTASPPAYDIDFERFPVTGLDLVGTSQPTPGTGQITFDATTVGTYMFRAVVTDDTDTTMRRRIDVEVVDHLEITIDDLPTGEMGAGYSAPLTVNAALGPLTWTAEGLPAGLSIDAATGEIHGTMTAEGSWPVTVTADDTTGRATATFTLRIGPPTGRLHFPGGNYTGTLSADGRWLAYEQMAQSNGVQTFDVYLRSTVTGAPPVKVSQNAAGTLGGGVQPNDTPGISADGRFVTFTSWQRLTAGDTNNVDDVYRYDRTDGSLALVPLTAGRRAGPVSQDGRYVVALSPASSEPLYGALWRIDVVTGVAERIDATATGGSPSHTVARLAGASISDDGRRVLFNTQATNLDPADTDTLSDVFVKDVTTGAITSLTAGLTDGGHRVASVNGTLSDDGRLLAVVTTNPTTSDTAQVLLDRSTGEKLTLAGGTDRVRVSADGSTVTYVQGHVVPGTPGIGGSPPTYYSAVHRATVTTGPLALGDEANLSLNHDGSEPRVSGTTPVVGILGLSDNGAAVLWYSNYGYQMPGVYGGGGFFLHRKAR